jgi:hypothetical protein
MKEGPTLTAWYITIRRICIFTGNPFPQWLPKQKGACGTHLNTCRAETTSRFLKRSIDCADDDPSMPIIDEIECSDSARIAAHPYTSSAADAQIKVFIEQRIIFDNGQVFKDISRSLGFDAYIFYDSLELTVTEPETATLGFRNIQRTGKLRTPFLLSAG